jgi:hypothetical protein
MGKVASGFRVKKFLAVVLLLSLTGMAELFAFEIHFEEPTFGPTSHPYYLEFRNTLRSVFNDALSPYRDLVRDISDNPQKMIGAFANSSVFSSTGASLRTFQGYDTFALTVGAMGGIQFPVSVNSMFRNLEFIGDKILGYMNSEGDLQLGVNPQMVNAQLGINTSRFLLKGLYIGLKGGYMGLPAIDLDVLKISFQTWSFGGMINYQLIPQMRIPTGIIVWRGLNIGTGLIYQSTNFSMDVPLIPENGSVAGQINIGDTGAVLLITDPKIGFRFIVGTYTVPLEAVTSIRLLGFMNFSVGAGVDFGFGSARMRGDLDTDINVRLPSNQVPGYDDLHQINKGRMYFTIDGLNSPTPINPKLMASFALSAGPAIILDIPITYYFQNNGFNIGVTFGVAL